MDCCCFNRPFDEQSNPIVHLEAEAVKIILSLCEQGVFTLILSQILKFEIEKTPDILRREKLKSLEQIARSIIRIDEEIEKRAKHFEKLGLQSFDALHLACAEQESDIILTVDRKFLRNVKRIKDLKIEIKNPLDWIKEVYYGENY
jgi:predicted nucleic acid-binding protein